MLGATALDGSHLVGVGTAGGNRPAAWESVDAGATWSPAWTGEAGTVAGVAAGPTGLVAVGWTGGEDEAGSPSRAAVWRSPDGSAGGWQPVAATGLEGAAALHDVVADGAGLVAVGRDVNDDADDGDGGIWRSDDGGTWRRAATAGLGGPGRQELHRLIRLADGRWLALGRQMRGAQMTPAVWTSPDLSTWTETDGHPSDGGGVPSVWGLAVLDDGAVVAAGSKPGLRATPRERRRRCGSPSPTPSAAGGRSTARPTAWARGPATSRSGPWSGPRRARWRWVSTATLPPAGPSRSPADQPPFPFRARFRALGHAR
jgi:hypothetical protein